LKMTCLFSIKDYPNILWMEGCKSARKCGTNCVDS
jgi:hypothetical protein